MKKIKKACCTALIVGMMLPQVVTCGAVSAASGTWKHNAKGWWYSYSDGSYAKSTWEKIGGKWYYFDSNGYMVTGWNQIGKKWYYFNTSGVMVTGWKQIGKKWYFFNTSGVMVTGWKQIGKKWYFFNSSGNMVTGWKQITKQWYYFDNNGCMANSSRVIKGKYYRFANDGKWINDENAYLLIHEKKYYFADGYGIKNLADAENGFEWDEYHGGTRYFRKVLKDGTVTTDPAYASTHSDGSEISLSRQVGAHFIDEKRGRVGTHVTYDDLLKIHGIMFYAKCENDTLFPQISEEKENAFLYHPSPVAKSQNYVVENAFVIGNRIVGTDFVDEDYEKVVKAWKKYGTNEKFNEEVQRAVKNGESSYARLYDWCDDENYLPFLLENGAFGDDRSRDWEEMVQNKDQYRVVLTRCKLLGMVYSGEIKQFAEITKGPRTSSYRTITIYAQDSELIRILDNYKIPSDWYEDKLSN